MVPFTRRRMEGRWRILTDTALDNRSRVGILAKAAGNSHTSGILIHSCRMAMEAVVASN